MKRLILLRHAKSSWSNDRLADADRPLTDRGERDAPRMGARLLERGIRPDLVLSSPAVRARSTARFVAGPLSYEAGDILLEPALYLATPEKIMEVVAAQLDSVDSLLVVGHNPGLTDLARALLPDFALEDLPTSGTVVIDFSADRWSDIQSTRRQLVYYDFPQNPGPAPKTD